MRGDALEPFYEEYNIVECAYSNKRTNVFILPQVN